MKQKVATPLPGQIRVQHARLPAPGAFGTGLIALDIILSANPTVAPAFAAGGTCGNVLTILSYLGWDAFPVARLNGDVASELVSADLARWDVALDFALQTPSAPTPIIIQRNRWGRDGTPHHRFSVACPACGAWFPSFRAVTMEGACEVIQAVTDASPSGFVPRVFFFDRVSRGAIMLAEAFANQGAVIVFEPVGTGDPRLFAEAIELTHVLKYSNERLPDFAARKPNARRLLLEIETLGAAGLRYRSSILPTSSWRRLDPVTAPLLLDSAGAGDWCTAGLLTLLATEGIASVADARAGDIAEALRYGQSAASVACGYEGARGAMEALDRKRFERMLGTLFRGEQISRHPESLTSSQGVSHSAVERPLKGRTARTLGVGEVCPACP